MFTRHCFAVQGRASLQHDHATEKSLDDVHAAVRRVERMHRRAEAARYRFWKMDNRQVAQCQRTEDARSVSAPIVRGHAAEGIYHRASA